MRNYSDYDITVACSNDGKVVFSYRTDGDPEGTGGGVEAYARIFYLVDGTEATPNFRVNNAMPFDQQAAKVDWLSNVKLGFVWNLATNIYARIF